jgi:peptidase E
MKLLLTSNGWKTNKKIKKIFLKMLNKPVSEVKVLVVSVSSNTKDENKHLSYHLNELEKLGIRRENINILSKRKKPKTRVFDVIYVCGGNTFLYMYFLRKTRWNKIIKNLVKNGCFYFGISAGSVIEGKRIDIANIGSNPDENIVNLKNYRGLNLVPFCIYPHYTKSDERTIKDFEKKKRCKVIRLKDKDFMLLDNRDLNLEQK